MQPQALPYYKIIQITDCHLFNQNQHLFSVDTNQNFISVINKIKKDELEDANAIFLTGDLSQDESKESYELIMMQLKEVTLPVYWIPGNHDSVEMMESIFSVQPFIKQSILETQHWNFIFLHTKENGTDKGYISKSQLQYLKTMFEQVNKNKSLGIVMHHSPVPVNTPLVDQYGLINAEEFMELIKNRVNLIICGHVHGDYSIRHENTVIEASPATCLQWEKGTSQLKIENKIGYKIYYLEEKNYTSKAILWDDKKTYLSI